MPSPLISPQSEDFIQLPRPSSLLLKRLAPRKNLTISTPSYNMNQTTCIHSAPLKIPPRTKNSRVTKKSTLLSPPHLKAPATAIVSRFPSPPIVPSQQPWTNHALTQKQKFLQPFEYLYDHIEQTRTLKMTLDDQIRRSSGLIQQLQKMNIPSIVQKETENYVQKEFQELIQECTQRIEKLEYKITANDNIPISPAISPPPSTCSIDVVLTQLFKRIDQLESKLNK